ncbi:SMAD/FHA domain-containing protein [Syncephalastrum racemosum]|uniref:SMAD/FHA domain-containing protein n=1 Tax=Syncephalastrum racemosum TaxID=13706 RepID=A0A1X2HNQ4_SYNRA|nr:SMAD/FHA domain-containing protein [Syncephalastrum racemosum]
MTTESIPPSPQLHDDNGNRISKQKGAMLLQSNIKPSTSVATLILQSKNAPFQTKTLELRDKNHIKIGRQTTSKSTPNPLNGYFDAKVLSRTHAELWGDKGKIYLKDVKSSNGTFLNGRRLSAEGEESPPAELKTGDVIEFGIDICNDDGSVLYSKVSCEVHILPTALSQVNTNLLKELSVGTNGSTNGRHTTPRRPSGSSVGSVSPSFSTSSLSSTSTHTSTDRFSSSLNTGPTKRPSRNLDLLLAKLQVR